MNRPAGYDLVFDSFYSFDGTSFDRVYFKYIHLCPSCCYLYDCELGVRLDKTIKCKNCGKIALLVSDTELREYFNPSFKDNIVGLNSIHNKLNSVKDIDYFETSNRCLDEMKVFNYYDKKEFSLLFGRVHDSVYIKTDFLYFSSSYALLNTFGGIDFYTLELLRKPNLNSMIPYLKDERIVEKIGYPSEKSTWFKYFIFRAAYLNTNILYQDLKGIQLEIYDHVFHRDRNNGLNIDCINSQYLRGIYRI